MYELVEWEFLYFHAWFNGREVKGRLARGDEDYFKFIGTPKVERWVLLKKFSTKNEKLGTVQRCTSGRPSDRELHSASESLNCMAKSQTAHGQQRTDGARG